MRKLINFILNLFRRKKKEQQKEFKRYYIKAKDSDSIYEINVHRNSLGLSLLKIAPQKAFDIVGEHVSWLFENVHNVEDAKLYGHSNQFVRIEDLLNFFGENTRMQEVYAYNMSTPKAEVNGWAKSTKGHKEALEGDYTHVVSVSEGKHRTAIFFKL